MVRPPQAEHVSGVLAGDGENFFLGRFQRLTSKLQANLGPLTLCTLSKRGVLVFAVFVAWHGQFSFGGLSGLKVTWEENCGMESHNLSPGNCIVTGSD